MSTSPLLTAWHVAAALLFVLCFRMWSLRRSKGPMPPGPVGWPLIGNVLDIPIEYSWKTFAKWGERWGEHREALPLGC